MPEPDLTAVAVDYTIRGPAGPAPPPGAETTGEIPPDGAEDALSGGFFSRFRPKRRRAADDAPAVPEPGTTPAGEAADAPTRRRLPLNLNFLAGIRPRSSEAPAAPAQADGMDLGGGAPSPRRRLVLRRETRVGLAVVLSFAILVAALVAKTPRKDPKAKDALAKADPAARLGQNPAPPNQIPNPGDGASPAASPRVAAKAPAASPAGLAPTADRPTSPRETRPARPAVALAGAGPVSRPTPPVAEEPTKEVELARAGTGDEPVAPVEKDKARPSDAKEADADRPVAAPSEVVEASTTSSRAVDAGQGGVAALAPGNGEGNATETGPDRKSPGDSIAVRETPETDNAPKEGEPALPVGSTGGPAQPAPAAAQTAALTEPTPEKAKGPEATLPDLPTAEAAPAPPATRPAEPTGTEPTPATTPAAEANDGGQALADRGPGASKEPSPRPEASTGAGLPDLAMVPAAEAAPTKGEGEGAGRWVPLPNRRAGRVAPAERAEGTQAEAAPATPRREPAATGPAEEATHVVRRKEDFWTIARYYYGSGRFYRALWAYNRDQVAEPEALEVGQTIRVPLPEALDASLVDPPKSPGSAAPGKAGTRVVAGRDADARRTRAAIEEGNSGPTPASRPTPTAIVEPDRSSERYRLDRPTHRVRRGENLRTIARDFLGDSRREEEILDLNRDKIDDPPRVAAGTRLVLPDDARPRPRLR